jgi:pimeloyl-ACP methyl ester carboxylesterase
MDLHTVRRGSGDPYVLIHGIGSRAEVWEPVMDALAAHFSVVAVDLAGFGQSRAQVQGPTIDRQAEAFAGWLRDEGLDGCHAGGNSMGGAISLELARRGVVRSAVAIAPAGFWTGRERRWCQDSLARAKAQIGLLRPVVPALASNPVGRTAFGWQLFGRPWAAPPAELVAASDALLGAEAFDEALALFDDYTFHDAEELAAVPVTIVWGARDRLLLARRQAARARRVLPGARHEWVEGAGHLAMWDAPSQIAALLVGGAQRGSPA